MKITIDAEANEITDIIIDVVTDRNLLLGATHEVVTETKRLIDDAFDFDGNKLRIKNADEVRKLKDLIDTFTDSSHDDDLIEVLRHFVTLFTRAVAPGHQDERLRDNAAIRELKDYLSEIGIDEFLKTS